MIINNTLFLVFTIIVIIIVIILNQNERGILTAILISVLFILIKEGNIPQLEHFDNDLYTEKPLITEMPIDHRDDYLEERDSFCSENTYKGAIDCDDSKEKSPYLTGPSADKYQYVKNSGSKDDVDIDAKQVAQGLYRNDYARAITGVVDRKNEMGKYVTEEVQDAETERWYGNEDF